VSDRCPSAFTKVTGSPGRKLAKSAAKKPAAKMEEPSAKRSIATKDLLLDGASGVKPESKALKRAAGFEEQLEMFRRRKSTRKSPTASAAAAASSDDVPSMT
jgi:hypothetical protein